MKMQHFLRQCSKSELDRDLITLPSSDTLFLETSNVEIGLKPTVQPKLVKKIALSQRQLVIFNQNWKKMLMKM